jgi:hypothetical protein
VTGTELVEAWAGTNGVAFDGRVVEVFGFSDAERYHLREVEVEVAEPDRKDRRAVKIGRGRGGAMFSVEATDWPAMEGVLQRLSEAKSNLAAGS